MSRLSFAVVAWCLATSVGAQAPPPEESPVCDKVAVLTIGTASLSDSVWSSEPAWSARMSFTIDPQTGAPMSASVIEFEQRASAGHEAADEATLRRISTDTMKRFRFCVPAGTDPQRRFAVRLRFAPVPSKEIYIQSFDPSYSADEIEQRRSGTVRVVTQFGVDGRVAKAEVRDSSGDAVLDQKALQSASTNRLIAAHGLPLDKPLSIEQPFNFQIK